MESLLLEKHRLEGGDIDEKDVMGEDEYFKD